MRWYIPKSCTLYIWGMRRRGTIWQVWLCVAFVVSYVLWVRDFVFLILQVLVGYFWWHRSGHMLIFSYLYWHIEESKDRIRDSSPVAIDIREEWISYQRKNTRYREFHIEWDFIIRDYEWCQESYECWDDHISKKLAYSKLFRECLHYIPYRPSRYWHYYGCHEIE